MKCIKLFKNNIACANDQLINEYIKSTSNIMLELHVCTSFFNMILEAGTLPESWLEDIIKPIYKKKVDPLQPEITYISQNITSVLERNIIYCGTFQITSVAGFGYCYGKIKK